MLYLNKKKRLEMKCCNESKGCKEVFLLESYYSHMKVCEYDQSKYYNCGTCGLSISIKYSNKVYTHIYNKLVIVIKIEEKKINKIGT